MCAWLRHDGSHLHCLDYTLHDVRLWYDVTVIVDIAHSANQTPLVILQHRWEPINDHLKISSPYFPPPPPLYFSLPPFAVQSCSLLYCEPGPGTRLVHVYCGWGSQDFADSAISCSSFGEGGASWRSVIVMWLEVWHVKRPPSFHPAMHGVFAGRQ